MSSTTYVRVTRKLKRVCKLQTPHVECALQQEAMSFAQVLGPLCPFWKYVWKRTSPPHPFAPFNFAHS